MTFSDVLKTIGYPEDIYSKFPQVLPFDLYEAQIQSLWQLLYHSPEYHNRFGLFSQTRTGKTIIMQLATIFFAHYGLKSMLVMPDVLYTQFIETFLEIGGKLPTYKIYEGTTAQRKKIAEKWLSGEETFPDIILLTRSLLTNMFTGSQEFEKPLYKQLLAEYKILMIDEAHLGLQDEGSAFYSACNNHINLYPGEGRRIIFSTGTPIYTSPNGTYPIISLLNPTAYWSREQYDNTHTIMKTISIKPKTNSLRLIQTKARTRQVPDRFVRLDQLNGNLFKYAVRVLRSEVPGLTIPALQILPVKLSPEHLRLYKTTLESTILSLPQEEIDIDSLRKIMEIAHQLVVSPHLLAENKSISNKVLDRLEVLIASLEDKFILYANYRNSIVTLYNWAAKLGLNPDILYGDGRGEDGAAEKFKKDQTCRVIVVNPQSGGVGLTLGKVCSTIICVEPITSPGLLEQAVSRTLLATKEAATTVYVLNILQTVWAKRVVMMKDRLEVVAKAYKEKEIGVKYFDLGESTINKTTLMHDLCLDKFMRD